MARAEPDAPKRMEIVPGSGAGEVGHSARWVEFGRDAKSGRF